MLLTRGSLGLQSDSSEQMESSTLGVVSEGDHCCFRMSSEMQPDELMFGW